MFNLISKKKALSAFLPLVKAVQELQYRVNATTQGFTIYGYNRQGEQIDAYASIADLYAICNKIMKTAAMIPLYEYNVTNEKAYSQYKIHLKKCLKKPTNQNIYELKKLQNKAMELAGEDSELQRFLDHPNKFQSKTEFYQLTYLFKLLAGNYYLYKEMLNAGANTGKIYEMYNLPPSFTFPIASNETPRRTAGFKFTLYNNNATFQPEEIIHGKYVNPVFDFSGNELIGLSPLCAGAKTLTTIGNETDYANQTLKNQGAGGIIVNKDPVNFTSESLGQMKDDVLKELGSAWRGNTNINANKLGFLAGQWEYIKVAIDPANMQLLEQSKFTFKKLCNVYGVSDLLFNNDSGSKYDNYDVALKELYTNTALPLVSGLCDDFNNPYNGLITHFGGNSIVGYDVSDIPEISENQDDVVKRFADSPGFKPNDLRESLGYGRDLGNEGEIFLIKNGYSLLTDIANPEIPDVGDYTNSNE